MPSLKDISAVYGPWAVVTGGASGIGAKFVSHLAAAGLSVVLIDRQAELLHSVSTEVSNTYPNIQTRTICVDLTHESAIQTISEQVQDLDIGLVVSNAGYALLGNFLASDEEDCERLIAVNVAVSSKIVHFFGRKLVTRNRSTKGKRSGVIMISSLSGSVPMPYWSLYSATKVFTSTLGMCLRSEWSSENIDVTVIEPGLIDTPLTDESSHLIDYNKLGFNPMSPSDLAKYAIRAFLAGKGRFSPGLKNQFVVNFMNFLPEAIRSKLTLGMLQTAVVPKALNYTPE